MAAPIRENGGMEAIRPLIAPGKDALARARQNFLEVRTRQMLVVRCL